MPTTEAIVEKVVKSTNDSLGKEDWSLIIDACDGITSADAPQIRSAVSALQRRLEFGSATTQLLSLTLFNALVQSGESKVTSQLATPEFCSTLESTYTKGSTDVRLRVKDIVLDLASSMGNEYPEFGRLRERLQTANGTAPAPESPEDDQDLQKALAMSIKASRVATSNNEISKEVERRRSTYDIKPSDIVRVRALYDYTAREPDDLEFKAGDIITVTESIHKDWWKGSLAGKIGVFPVNYVEEIASPQPAATEEDYIFAQAPNVEKLLSIFASASQHPGYSIVGNDDIQAMYQEVLSLRPKLIQLIDEYSARKQRLMELNQNVSDARTKYEQLVNARVAPSSGYIPTHQQSTYHSPYDRQRVERPPIPQSYTGPAADSYSPYTQAPLRPSQTGNSQYSHNPYSQSQPELDGHDPRPDGYRPHRASVASVPATSVPSAPPIPQGVSPGPPSYHPQPQTPYPI